MPTDPRNREDEDHDDEDDEDEEDNDEDEEDDDEEEDEEEDDEEEEQLHAGDITLLTRFLTPFARPYVRLLCWLGLALLIETLCIVSWPLLTRKLIDDGLDEGQNAIAQRTEVGKRKEDAEKSVESARRARDDARRARNAAQRTRDDAIKLKAEAQEERDEAKDRRDDQREAVEEAEAALKEARKTGDEEKIKEAEKLRERELDFLEKDEEDLAEKEQYFQDRSKALQSREEELKKREEELKTREQDATDAEKRLDDAEASLETIDEDFDYAKWVVIICIAVLAGAAILASVTGLIAEYIGAGVFAGMIKDMRQRLFDHLQTLSMPFYTRTRAGTILSRFSGDIVVLDETLALLLTSFVLPLCEVIGAVAVMYVFNVWLALIGTTLFPIILLGPRLFAYRAFAASYQKRQSEGQILAGAHENVAAQPVVKAFNLEERSKEDFRQRNTHWFPIAFRVNFLSALVERSTYMGTAFIHLIIFALGAYWVWIGKISFGTFVAFEGVFFEMGTALIHMTEFVPSLAHAVGSVHHLEDLFAKKPEVVDAPDAVPLPRFEREIVFDHVTFHYPEGRFRFEELNMTIAKGAFVAFVGATGSGKSTVLNLLLRFNDPTTGAIRVDGRDLRCVTQSSWRAQIGMVFQESFLFNATIGENIRMGLPNATQEQVEAAARAAEIHDFIVSLPRGYDTVVGERGSQLSGGQRQRVAIARALVRDPAILVLDEATSALDYATEAALNKTLFKVAKNRTVVMVTHRLSSVVRAQHIVVLDHGRVVERGTHRELLDKQGRYAKLWTMQKEQEAGH